ncbi:unnamed protein product [Closterium sp. NIES-65]|nr:unnamed protein product [Closterium sp. NIES-65]
MHRHFALTLLPVFSFERVTPSHLPLAISLSLSPFSSASQVSPFKPRSPCPLAIEAPIPSARTTQSAKYPFPHARTLACRTLVAVPQPVAPPLFPCAGFQVAGGCGVNTDAPSRPSPVAVQGGGTWRRAAAEGGSWWCCSCLDLAVTLSAKSPTSMPSPLPTTSWLVQVTLSGAGGGEGRWGQHRRSLTPLPWGRAGTRGDEREAALRHGNPTAARESIGMGLASQGHLAMQQRQLTGPVVAASALGSTDAAGEGRGGRGTQGGISRRFFSCQLMAPPLACAAFKLTAAKSESFRDCNTHRLCACSLQVEGRGAGVNTDTSTCLSLVAVQEGGREAALGGDGREAAL